MSDYTLHLGDCIAGMAGLADKSVDVTIMDPPFEAEAHGKGRRLTGTFAQARSNTREVIEKSISYPPITEEERSAAAQQVARVTRRWILVFCQSEATHKWRTCLETAGAQYIRTGVFWKLDAQPQYNGQCPGVGWEAIVIAHGLPRKGPTRWNGGGKCARWDASADARCGKSLAVDGQKPLHLMRQLVSDFTEPGELVMDPFVGAGTTGVACIELGRRFLGWERLEKHYGVALGRLVDARRQERMFVPLAPTEQLKLTGAA